ncbi:MAG: hypothetical protein ACK4NS_12965 [Saprospiraceae bacterium]
MKKIAASCAALLCALAIHAHALAGDPLQEFTRKIDRQFATTPNGMTVLDNAHGDISVQTSPAAREVRVAVTITVKAATKQEADRIFDAIQVNFTHTAGYVKAQTVIQKNLSARTGCRGFRVDYAVGMPAENQLDLSNRYGNTLVAGPLHGKLNVEIKYGDLKLEQKVNETQIYLDYGKLKADKMNLLQGQLNYSQLDANQTGDLRLESKYSRISVNRAANVTLNSRYDDLKLGVAESVRIQAKYGTAALQQVQNAYLTAQYSDFEIQSLRDRLDADLTYGKLDIVSMGRDFREVRVNTHYTDVSIRMEPGSHFRFDTEGKYNKISYPSAAFVSKRVESGQSNSLQGFVGDANAQRTVTARVHYGKFVIRQ